jgi:Holliday junction resolvase RusA-like endonuclease
MIELILEGEITPKTRPRVTANGTYMPPKYRQWKEGAILTFRSQYNLEPLIMVKSVSIELHGKHSRRGDADNISGSVLDALVQAGVIGNDNLMVVPRLSIALNYDPKVLPSAKILIDVDEPD